MKKKQRKNKNIKLLYLLGILGGTLILALFTNSLFPNAYSKIASNEARKSLQIEKFTLKTINQTPTPTPVSIPIGGPRKSMPTSTPIAACGIGESSQTFVNAEGTCCIEDGPKRQNETCCGNLPIAYSYYDPNIREVVDWCNAKPIIYLYPKTPTLVDVVITVPGKITVSIPTYPEGGWKKVLAHPSGKLTYQGKKYTELFYESSVTPIPPPTKGFVVPIKDVQDFLKDFTKQLGLKENESNDLISYWTPRLIELNSPYFFISVFDPVSKDKIDHVEITPIPDVFIQMILYFRPMDKIEKIEQLEITPAPERAGFTAVEWGGIIDAN